MKKVSRMIWSAVLFLAVTALFFVSTLQKQGQQAPADASLRSETSNAERTSDTSSAPVANDHSVFYEVTKVIDGDTIDVVIDGKTEKVRFIGINAPETKDCFGANATEKLKDIIRAKRVALQADNSQGDRDKYQRLLRYLFTTEGLNVAEEMLRQGYAREYTYDRAYLFQSTFREAQNEAKNEKRGLWADGTCPKDASDKIECGFNKYNCADFKTQAESQAVYEFCKSAGVGDIHKMDIDQNGKACESLL